jgi:cleavage and polyadenylation specificity factor subunit 1
MLASVIPIPDITAATVACPLLTGWISRFGYLQTVTTDLGRQFESQLFKSLARMCGIQLLRTTTHHSAANGLMERFHQTLKAAMMCTRTNSGQRHFPWFSSEYAQRSKKNYKHLYLSWYVVST